MKLILSLIILSFSLTSFAQGKTPHETVSIDSASVTYGRPSTNGRQIFGNMQKFGDVWRAGADQATTITFTKNVKFAGADLAAGTYTLFVIPYEDQWTIILNSQLGQWGSFSYGKHKDKDVLNVNVPVTAIDEVVDQLTFRFPSATSLIIEWDKTQVTIPITW